MRSFELRTKKNLFLIFIIFILYFVGCKEQNLQEVTKIELVSPLEHTVCEKDAFRLDSLWIDLTYENGNIKRHVVNEDMLSKEDLNKIKEGGDITITITIGDVTQDIKLYLYTKESISKSMIYILHTFNENVQISNTLNDVETNIPNGMYFYNWYTNEERTTLYKEQTSGFINLYAKYSFEKTYCVKFFHEDVLIKEEYVLEGQAAHPPIMPTYDDYVFYGWDQDYGNVSQDLNIYSIYKNDGICIQFLDYYGEIINTQYSLDGEIHFPVLEDIGEYVFVSWSEESDSTEHHKIYHPIYKIKSTFRVSFYHLDTFLYSIEVNKGDSITFDMERAGLDKEKYVVNYLSESLENISSDKKVLVEYYFTGIQYSYYVFEKLYYEEITMINRFPEEFKELIPNYMINLYWKQNEEDPYRYDLAFKQPEFIFLICNETDKTYSTSISLFLEIGPSYYIGTIKKEYVFYEWYYDENYENPITDFSDIYGRIVIYGKQIDLINTKYDTFSFIDIGHGYHIKLKENDLSMDNVVVHIPKTYNHKPVIKMDLHIILRFYYCFIPDSIEEIIRDDNLMYSNSNSEVYVEKTNLFYYHNKIGLYEDKRTNPSLLLVCCSYIDELHFTKDVKVESCAFLQSCEAQKVYIEEGIEEFIIPFELSFNTIYIASSVKRLYHNSDYTKGSKIVFMGDSQLEYIDSSFLQTKEQIVLPKSLKYIRIANQGALNIHIDKDNPYLTIEDNLLLSKDKTILFGFVGKAQSTKCILPSYIKKLFAHWNYTFHTIGYERLYIQSLVEYDKEYNGFVEIGSLIYLDFDIYILNTLSFDFPFVMTKDRVHFVTIEEMDQML